MGYLSCNFGYLVFSSLKHRIAQEKWPSLLRTSVFYFGSSLQVLSARMTGLSFASLSVCMSFLTVCSAINNISSEACLRKQSFQPLSVQLNFLTEPLLRKVIRLCWYQIHSNCTSVPWTSVLRHTQQLSPPDGQTLLRKSKEKGGH